MSTEPVNFRFCDKVQQFCPALLLYDFELLLYDFEIATLKSTPGLDSIITDMCLVCRYILPLKTQFSLLAHSTAHQMTS